MRGRKLSEYGLPQPQAVDNDRFTQEYCQEIDYDRDEQLAYLVSVLLDFWCDPYYQPTIMIHDINFSNLYIATYYTIGYAFLI